LPPDLAYREIPLDEIPKRLAVPALRQSLLWITAVRETHGHAAHLVVVCGSAGAGLYGLDVGRPDFHPTSGKPYYREWRPGMFVYFLPPF